MKSRFFTIFGLFLPIMTQTAASSTYVGVGSNNGEFTLRSLGTDTHNGQSIICIHRPSAKACVMGIISGPNQDLCKQIADKMWNNQHKKKFFLKSNHKKNAQRFWSLNQTVQIMLRDNIRTYSARDKFFRDLPARISWLSVSYADDLQYVAHAYSSSLQQEPDLPVGEKVNITGKAVSLKDGNIICTVDGHEIQFKIPLIPYNEDDEEDAALVTTACTIQ